jgi:hypothetical protein
MPRQSTQEELDAWGIVSGALIIVDMEGGSVKLDLLCLSRDQLTFLSPCIKQSNYLVFLYTLLAQHINTPDLIRQPNKTNVGVGMESDMLNGSQQWNAYLRELLWLRRIRRQRTARRLRQV